MQRLDRICHLGILVLGLAAPSIARAGSACAVDVAQELSRLPSQSRKFAIGLPAEFPHGNQLSTWGWLTGDFMRHIQGVALLPDQRHFVMSGNAAGGSFLFTSDGRAVIGILPLSEQYHHPGGIQALGSVVAVGTDQFQGSDSEVRFFDFRDPRAPQELKHLKIFRKIQRAESVGWVRIPQGPMAGRILLVAGSRQTRELTFYRSTGVDLFNLETRFEKIADWEGPHAPKRLPNYQALNLVAQCDGKIFLIGTIKRRLFFDLLPWGGEDYLDLLEVAIDPAAPQPEVSFRRVQHRTFKLTQANLSAGGGILYDEREHRFTLLATDFWPRTAGEGRKLTLEQLGPSAPE